MGFELTTLAVLGTDYTGSSKSNYHMISTTRASRQFEVSSGCCFVDIGGIVDHHCLNSFHNHFLNTDIRM